MHVEPCFENISPWWNGPVIMGQIPEARYGAIYIIAKFLDLAWMLGLDMANGSHDYLRINLKEIFV